MNVDNCDHFNDRLTHWLESSWERTQNMLPDELQQHADNCQDCRRQLDLTLRILGTEYKQTKDLTDKVMTKIRNYRPPRSLQWAPAVAAAALFIFALGLGLFLGTTGGNSVTVELSLQAPQATRVAVVGGWNNWDPTRDLLTDPDGDGLWQIKLDLRTGKEYLYQFIIDDNIRVADPYALINLDDGFGSINSVLNL